MEEVIKTINLLNNASKNGNITSRVYNEKISICIKDMETLSHYKQKVMEITERNKFENFARNSNRFDYEPMRNLVNCELYNPVKNNTSKCCTNFVKNNTYQCHTNNMKNNTFQNCTYPRNVFSSIDNVWEIIEKINENLLFVYELYIIITDKYEKGEYKSKILQSLCVLFEKYLNGKYTNMLTSIFEKIDEETVENLINYLNKFIKNDEEYKTIIKTLIEQRNHMKTKDSEKLKECTLKLIILIIKYYLTSIKEKKESTREDVQTEQGSMGKFPDEDSNKGTSEECQTNKETFRDTQIFVEDLSDNETNEENHEEKNQLNKKVNENLFPMDREAKIYIKEDNTLKEYISDNETKKRKYE